MKSAAQGRGPICGRFYAPPPPADYRYCYLPKDHKPRCVFTSRQPEASAAKKPDPNCPSCHGTGWATIRVPGITVAGGICKCRGGLTWAK